MRILLIFLLLIVFNDSIYSQNTQSRSAIFYKHITQALTFYLTVGYISDKIIDKRTTNSQQLYLEKLRFNGKYSKAITNLKKVIGSEDSYNQVLKLIPLNTLDEYYKKFTITDETTINFIDKIKSYLDGSNQEEGFRSLLIFQYFEKPTDEFSDNFTNLFNTTNHPKSKNTKWTIRYPKSWQFSESNRPNTICTIKNESDSLLSSTMVTLRVEELTVSNQDYATIDYTTIEFAKKIIPKNAEIIEFKKINIENCPSGSIEYMLTQQGTDNILNTRFIYYYFVFGKKVYFIICGCVMDDKKYLETIWKKNLPIFKLIANSVILLDKYQKLN